MESGGGSLPGDRVWGEMESKAESEELQQLREGNQEVATAKEKERGKEIGREIRWCPSRKASRSNCF